MQKLPDGRLVDDAFVAYAVKDEKVIGVFSSRGLAQMKLVMLHQEAGSVILPCKVVFNPSAPPAEPPAPSESVDTVEAFTS